MTMSMNLVIHGAVRRDLDRFVDALERFPDGDRSRAEDLHRAWHFFDDELTRHHEGEHEIAWPALLQVGVSAQTLATMDAEHEVMADALHGARASMATLRAEPTSGSADRARAAVAELQQVTVTHLEHEEREIEPTYQAHLEHPAIKEMGRRFARAQKPPQAGRFFAWVTNGAGPEEKAAASHGIPRPVMAVLGLLGRGYRRDVAPVWQR